MSSIRIKLSEGEAERLLDSICERTGTDRALWEELADLFIERYRALGGFLGSGRNP